MRSLAQNTTFSVEAVEFRKHISYSSLRIEGWYCETKNELPLNTEGSDARISVVKLK